MKKLVLILLTFASLLCAQKPTLKQGCILAQDGEVRVNWQDKNTNGGFKNVKYTAIQKEGVNFKEIFLGSMIEIGLEKKPISLEIVGMKANPRVKPDPRTGTMKIKVMANKINKEINMHYTYNKNTLVIKGKLDVYGYQMIDIQTKIKAVLCKI